MRSFGESKTSRDEATGPVFKAPEVEKQRQWWASTKRGLAGGVDTGSPLLAPVKIVAVGQ